MRDAERVEREAARRNVPEFIEVFPLGFEIRSGLALKTPAPRRRGMMGRRQRTKLRVSPPFPPGKTWYRVLGAPHLRSGMVVTV